MQRSLILIASLTTALALAGCGQSDDEPQAGNGGQPSVDEAAQPESPEATEPETVDAEPLTLEGSVTYRERIALPDQAQLTVQLLDVSLADAAAETLAEVSFVPDQEVPIDFALEYDATTLTVDGSYAVRAEIHDAAGELLWTTADHHAVELGPEAEQESVEIMLQRVAAEPQDEAEESADEAPADAEDAEAEEALDDTEEA